MSDPADDPSDSAGEYVLGTLADKERQRFEAALAHDGALQAAVYTWQDRLLRLSAQTAPATPSAALWSRIDTSLTAMAKAPPQRARSTRTAPPPWWRRLGLWQGLSGLAVAASLLLAVLLLQRVAEPEGARYLALLQSPDSQATGWVVEVQAGRQLKLVPVADRFVVPPGRSLQFWTKAEGAAAPTSLGLVRSGQTVQMPVSRLPAVEARQLFEITLEPENGSPIGRPTGPILYLGRTVAL